jgi:hypothetical protein
MQWVQTGLDQGKGGRRSCVWRDCFEKGLFVESRNTIVLRASATLRFSFTGQNLRVYQSIHKHHNEAIAGVSASMIGNQRFCSNS